MRGNALKGQVLLPLKAVLFLVYGGEAVLLPYLAIFFKSLDFDIETVALLYATQPIAAVIASVASAALKRRCHIKLAVCLLLSAAALANSLLLLIPPLTQPQVHFRLTVSDNNFTLQLLSSVRRGDDFNLTSSRLYLEECNGTYTTHLSQRGSDAHFVSVAREGDTFSLEILGLSLSEFLRSPQTLKSVYNGTVYDRLDFSANGSTVCNVSLPVDKNHRDRGNRVALLHALAAVFVSSACTCLSLILIEFVVATNTIQRGSEVGLQRLWTFLGVALCSLLCGLLVELTGDARVMFYLHDAAVIVVILLMPFLDVSDYVAPQPWTECKNAVSISLKGAPMFIAVVVLGATWGFLNMSTFWYMEDKLASRLLWMTLTLSVETVSCIVYCLSNGYVRKCQSGYAAVFLASAAYCVRFVGYHYATSPVIFVAIAVLESLTTVNLVLALAQRGSSTLRGVSSGIPNVAMWSSVHVISGRVLGTLLGALVLARHGALVSFRYWSYATGVLAASAAVLGVVHAVFDAASRKKVKDDQIRFVAGRPVQTRAAPLSVAAALSLAAVTRTWMAGVISASSESWPISGTGARVSAGGKFTDETFQKELMELRQSRLHTFPPNAFSRSASVPAVPSRHSVAITGQQRMSLPPVLEEPAFKKPEGRLKVRLEVPEASEAKENSKQASADVGECTRF